MAKQFPQSLQTHFESGTTTLAWCWRLTRNDGAVFGFTDHDRPLTFDGTTFEPESGFTASEIRAGSDLSVDAQEAEGVLTSTTITETDILDGRWDNATVEIWRVNWADTTSRALLRRGGIGQVRRGRLHFVAEMRSLAHVLGQTIGRTFQASCDAALGDVRCGVDLNAPAFKATGMTTTPNLSLPYLAAAQAQKHVTLNEALSLIDALAQMAVAAVGATTPPGTPAEGDRHIIGTGATGAWNGWDNSIALFSGGAWLRMTPQTGWMAWDVSAGELLVWNGAAWVSFVPNLQNLAGVGIGTVSDATNRLAVSAAATLLNHAGNGHQLKINKAASGDTASLLFQANWSGRAEMGTAGSDDFVLKVSADGSTFHEALRADGNTGAARFPGGIDPERRSIGGLIKGGGSDWWGPVDPFTLSYSSGSPQALSQDKMYFMPVFVDRPVQLLGAFVSLGTASTTAGALIRCGIYRLGAATGMTGISVQGWRTSGHCGGRGGSQDLRSGNPANPDKRLVCYHHGRKRCGSLCALCPLDDAGPDAILSPQQRHQRLSPRRCPAGFPLRERQQCRDHRRTAGQLDQQPRQHHDLDQQLGLPDGVPEVARSLIHPE